jgi:hypothetical protein
MKTKDDIKFARTLFLEKKKESAGSWDDSQKLVYSAIFSSLFELSTERLDKTPASSSAQASSASALTPPRTRQAPATL